MVVAEATKMDKGEPVSAGPPNWVSGPLGWGPQKLRELRTFFVEVKSEHWDLDAGHRAAQPEFAGT